MGDRRFPGGNIPVTADKRDRERLERERQERERLERTGTSLEDTLAVAGSGERQHDPGSGAAAAADADEEERRRQEFMDALALDQDPNKGGGGGGGAEDDEPPPVEEGPPVDWTGELIDDWDTHADPYRQDYLDAAGTAGDELIGIGQDRTGKLRGGDAYQALRGQADGLLEHYKQGGLTDVTRAQLESNRRGADQFVRSNREAALQDLAERGMAGGGAEVLALQGDRAAAADRMNAQDLDAAAFGQKSAMDAFSAYGNRQRDLYGDEEDWADTEAEAEATASGLRLDASQHMADIGLKTVTDVTREVREKVSENIDKLNTDALGAGNDAGDVLIDKSDDALTGAKDVITGEELDVDLEGGGTAGETLVPGVAPTPNADTAQGVMDGVVEGGKAVVSGGTTLGLGGGGGTPAPTAENQDRVGFGGVAIDEEDEKGFG